MLSRVASAVLAKNGLAMEKGSAAVASVMVQKHFSSSAMPQEVETSELSAYTSSVSDAHRPKDSLIKTKEMLLMGPGPSNSYPRVLDAMGRQLIGHMHKPCFDLQDEVQEGLRYVFQTEGKYVIGLSASGGAAMETTVVNLLEPGEKALVSVAGIWGERFSEMCERHGAEAVQLRKDPGESLSLDEIAKALEEHKPQVLFLCHGESSSGTKQNLEGVGELCAKHGTLFAVDTVCTLAGEPFFVDDWGIDLVYSGAQKCLSCPPGLSPIFFSDKAMEKIHNRKTKVDIFNFDITEVGKQWGFYGEKRPYHHTPPVSLLFAMREALNITAEVGLPTLWENHLAAHNQLWDGLSGLGLKPFVTKAENRLSTVNCISIPEGVDGPALQAHAMNKYGLEIAGGLGGTAGKIWRIGLMGYNCTPRNVDAVITAFKSGLEEQRFL